MTALLVCAAVLVLFLPENIADITHTSRAAWEYVAYGVQAAVLWLVVGSWVRTLPLRFVALWAFLEAAARPTCRLCFAMDKPPPKLGPGQTLCDVALGFPTLFVSVPAALFAACLLQEAMREKGR